MTKKYTLTLSSKDAENPEYTQVLTLISETYKKSEVIIDSNISEDNLIKHYYGTLDAVLINMLQAFFSAVSKDEFDIEYADKDYFYQSLAEAIFYYVDSEHFGNHFAYNEIIIKNIEISKKL